MRFATPLRHVLVMWSAAGILCAPASAWAESSNHFARGDAPAVRYVRPANVSKIRDVELADAGTLRGQVLDRGGAPARAAFVRVFQSEQLVAETKADDEGRFEIRGLRGGLVGVSAAGTKSHLRLWASGTAPPAATPEVLLVAEGESVRGQRFGGISDGVFRIDEWGGMAAIIAIIGGGAVAQKQRVPASQKQRVPAS